MACAITAAGGKRRVEEAGTEFINRILIGGSNTRVCAPPGERRQPTQFQQRQRQHTKPDADRPSVHQKSVVKKIWYATTWSPTSIIALTHRLPLPVSWLNWICSVYRRLKRASKTASLGVRGVGRPIGSICIDMFVQARDLRADGTNFDTDRPEGPMKMGCIRCSVKSTSRRKGYCVEASERLCL